MIYEYLEKDFNEPILYPFEKVEIGDLCILPFNEYCQGNLTDKKVMNKEIGLFLNNIKEIEKRDKRLYNKLLSFLEKSKNKIFKDADCPYFDIKNMCCKISKKRNVKK